MSCKDKWAEDATLLAAATQIAPGSADAAPRCVKPECNRPLRKDGTCVMGHAQAGRAAAFPPQIDAMRCAWAELDAEYQRGSGWDRLQRLYLDGYFQKAQALLDKAHSAKTSAAAEKILTEVVEHFYNAVRVLYPPIKQINRGSRHTSPQVQTWWQAPRFQAASTASLTILLDRAQARLAKGDADSISAAWQGFWQAWQYAEQWELPGMQTLAEQGLRQVIPVDPAGGYYPQLGKVLPRVLARETGLRFGYPGYNTRWEITERDGVYIRAIPGQTGEPLDPTDTNLAPTPFTPAATQALQSLGLHPKDTECLVTIDVIHRLLTHSQDAAVAAAASLSAHTGTLQSQPGSPAEVASTQALSLWQAAWQMESQYGAELVTAAAGEQMRAVVRQAKEAAMQVLRQVPPPQLPQVLAGLGYEKRVMDLLRFKAVRQVVFDPASPIDVLAHLPTLAPKAVAALGFCDAVESLVSCQDRGPRTPQEVQAMVRASTQRERMARWEMVGRDEPATQWEEALARLVDGLSEHAPGNRPPYKGDGTGYLAGSRLAQAEELFSSLWGAGTNTERSSLEDVRAWGDTAGMPLARYLDRDSIVQWLREDNPVWREKHLRQSTIRLHRKPLATLQAVDRAGIDRTYKKRERVHLAIGGADQEGEIVYCTFIAGPTPGDLVQPAVRVRLADAQTAQALAIAGGYEQMWGAATQDVFVPIAQVELVKKSKS